jgi:hypothetical protein
VHLAPETRAHALRRRIGNLLLVAGLCGATTAYGALALKGIVVDSDIAASAANRAIADPRVQTLLIDQTADAVREQLVGPQALATLRSYGYDPTSDIDAMAAAVVAAPEFRGAFVTSVRELHRAVFVDRSAAPVIDATAVMDVARQTAVDLNPDYAELLPPATSLRVTIPAADLPDLTSLGSGLGGRSTSLGALSLAAAVAGVALHSARGRALRRAGGWCLGLGLAQSAIAFLLPVAASGLGGEVGPIAEAIARTLLSRLLAPAAIIGGVGVGLMLAGWRWQRWTDRRNERIGAAAFLEVDEQPALTDWALETAELRSPMGAPPVRRLGVR